jgi:hypothetical protein
MLDKVVQFFQWAKGVYEGSKVLQAITTVLQITSLVVGVKGFLQARQMLAKGQDILANKTSAGGKIPVIYGTRRVGAQVIYMDVSNNDSRHLFVVYALSVGECDEILGRTIELDGNPITDPKRFRYGCYVGSDRNGETGYSGHRALNTVSQIGSTTSAGNGGFGTSSTSRYRITFNLHHGEPTQSADPMLVASMPNWTSSHKLNGVCYIAAHYKYDKKGMFGGVPQLTVQVKGKRVYDPRDNTQTFGTPSTYKHSSNPALCFLDLITNNEYGKGLTASQLNMSTFSSAATVCDTKVDQPYFNGTAQSVTWSANSGDNFFTITGTGANDIWWQNKVDEVISIYDQNGDDVLTNKEITDIQRTNFFDTNQEFVIFINDYFSSNYSSVGGSTLLKVKRFHCNGYLDTNKNVMDNAKELLANMRGVFLYVDGQYELQIEDTGTSTFTITDDHIISDAGISVDYGNKDKKANKVIVEFFNANKKYELDTATVLHDASPQYYSDDGDEILEIKAEFPYVTDPYIAYNMAKAILTRSRNQTTMQFLGTPEMYKLNVGDIVTLAYTPLGFTGKISRVEALELQPNGLVAVSLIEYFDVYTWEVPPQEPVEELSNLPSAYAVKAPTNISFTDSDSSSTGRPFLSWDEPTDFPDYQYRVNVVDSSGNQLMNRIVDVDSCDLTFIPTGSFVANITSLNTLGVESSPARFPATGNFTVGTPPTGSGDIQDGAVDLDALAAEVQSAIDAGGVNSTQLIKSTTAPTTRTDSSALQAQDLWVDTDDDNQIYVRNSSNNGWEKARDSSLVTLYNSLSSTVTTNSSNIATAQSDIVTLTTDTSANTTAITNLTSTVNSNTSAITTEQTTRANADSALAADITSLTSTVNGNTASITSEATTRANADTALAADITSLTSTVNGNTADITSESVTRANADTALAADITSLTSTVNGNTASISSEAATRASADSALAADITSLTSTVNSNTADITSEAVTRANADSALASDITSLTSSVNGNTASITTNATAITDINDNASASYVLQLNANGKVAQMVLESNADSGSGATSTIAFLADTFKIDNDAGSSVSPFVVSGGSVLIDNATINNLSADKILIDGVTIDTDGSGNLILGNFNAFTNANAGSIGIIDGTAGESGDVTEFNELYRTGYTVAEPYHIASIASSGSYAVGDVLGSSSVTTVTGDVPLFSHQFTTANYSGTRTFIIHGEVDYEGSSSSATETLFVMSVKQTSNLNDYTSTSASDYLASEHFSASGSYALGNRGVNAKITVAGNTTITVWCFGATDDVGGSNTAGTSSFDHGAITVYGLNK